MPAGRYQTAALFRLFFNSSISKLDSSSCSLLSGGHAASLRFFDFPTDRRTP
jgi:hypothetical protein